MALSPASLRYPGFVADGDLRRGYAGYELRSPMFAGSKSLALRVFALGTRHGDGRSNRLVSAGIRTG